MLRRKNDAGKIERSFLSRELFLTSISDSIEIKKNVLKITQVHEIISQKSFIFSESHATLTHKHDIKATVEQHKQRYSSTTWIHGCETSARHNKNRGFFTQQSQQFKFLKTVWVIAMFSWKKWLKKLFSFSHSQQFSEKMSFELQIAIFILILFPRMKNLLIDYFLGAERKRLRGETKHWLFRKKH